ncbi:MAG: hypothetical protein EA367_07440 [Leptolyngbya sp. DLM2.Bin15]|nr:MAG: hypothetical protein EA367_07440 [Leptolyngbya sp. DLM2.Bin15]
MAIAPLLHSQHSVHNFHDGSSEGMMGAVLHGVLQAWKTVCLPHVNHTGVLSENRAVQHKCKGKRVGWVKERSPGRSLHRLPALLWGMGEGEGACRNPGGASCCQDSDVYNGVAVGIRDWGMTVNDRVAADLSRGLWL